MLPHFERDILRTGKRLSSLIDYAETMSVEDVEAMIAEIDRVVMSPFANVPPGAREQAVAFLDFKKALGTIE